MSSSERLKEIARLYLHDAESAELDVLAASDRLGTAERELSAVSASIGSVRWMDPPDGGSVTLAEQVGRMRERIEELESALTPSAETKADYIGEFQFTVSTMELDESDEPYECQRTVTVPWTTIKNIMGAIRARAVRP